MNTLVALLDYGQSYWLDNLSREKITSGELKKRVTEQGLRGITSNPSIFHKSISGSSDYDDQIKSLVAKKATVQQIYDALTIKDVQDACDILKPVYDHSGGIDGFVSLEVSPYLARNTEGSISEARRLYQLVERQNCLIKIPGTKEGIPAIEQLLYEGININVTLLFSIERYTEVAHAYIRAIQRRVAEGKPVSHTVSVASFFLSRIDVLTDQLLSQQMRPTDKDKDLVPQLLFGKAGIASAQLAYQIFKELFGTASWKALADKGAQVQRPLWASTSNKDPLYSDVRYVETLIGKDTINTLPDETIEAFADHGKLEQDTIEDHIAEAHKVFEDLKSIGIDIDAISQSLEQDGIRKFIEPFNQLMSGLAEKRRTMEAGPRATQSISYGALKEEMAATYRSMDEKQIGARLYNKDPYLWKTEPQQAKMIVESMGWLSLPDDFASITAEIMSFSQGIKEAGFNHAVLLGMGGSSLCSEVARETFGTAKGYPELLVLDNTEPAAIREIQDKIDLKTTLFIAASKSGGTKETISFFKYFYQQLVQAGQQNPGAHFVAITDAATPLVAMAETYQFRKTFINPKGIGGRYSVLSDFGLLPMALMGIDIQLLMARTQKMKHSSDAHVPIAVNPAISLGATLGICQKKGRDKITFILSSSIASFGYWVEQLLAESTGKEGKGLIPVNGETLGDPNVYADDRVFVHLSLVTDDSADDEQKLDKLEAAGHPIIRIKLEDKMALGAEYYRWEIAAAVAGIVIGINPYDQPNVEQSKKNTSQLLNEWKQTKSFKLEAAAIQENGLSIFGTEALMTETNTVAGYIETFLAQAQSHDYIAFLPYFSLNAARTKLLQSWRQTTRDRLKVATTLLNGPRYLHSTGQLHKGGPDTGLYILLVADETTDLAIPDEDYGFATLHEAQYLGDFRSLQEKGRRLIRIHLGKDLDKGLNQVLEQIQLIKPKTQ